MAEKKSAPAAESPKSVHIGGESFLDRLLPHLRKIIVGIVVLTVLLSVIFTVRWFRTRKQVSATAALDRILEIAQERIRGKDEKPDPKQPSFASTKERATAVLDEIAKHGNEVASFAFHGKMLLDAGRTDEAIAEYRKGLADKSIEGVFCREGLGIALETKASAEKDAAARQKGLEEALDAFVAMQPDEAGPRRAYALYHQARIQLLLGKRAEAKALFDKAKTANQGADRDLADLIEKRLASLGAA